MDQKLLWYLDSMDKMLKNEYTSACVKNNAFKKVTFI